MGNPEDVLKHDLRENTMSQVFNYINQTGPYRLLAGPTSVMICLSWLQVRDLVVYMMGLLPCAWLSDWPAGPGFCTNRSGWIYSKCRFFEDQNGPLERALS